PPPPPTLFPYTTLFRSHPHAEGISREHAKAPMRQRSIRQRTIRGEFFRLLRQHELPKLGVDRQHCGSLFLETLRLDHLHAVCVGDRKSTRLNSSHLVIS